MQENMLNNEQIEEFKSNSIDELKNYIANQFDIIKTNSGEDFNIFLHVIEPGYFDRDLDNDKDIENIMYSILDKGLLIRYYSMLTTTMFYKDNENCNIDKICDYHLTQDQNNKRVAIYIVPKQHEYCGKRYDISTPLSTTDGHNAKVSIFDLMLKSDDFIPKKFLLGCFYINKKTNTYNFYKNTNNYAKSKNEYDRIADILDDEIDKLLEKYNCPVEQLVKKNNDIVRNMSMQEYNYARYLESIEP